MRRYPFNLEVWHEEDATQNPDGSFNEGYAEWVQLCACNAHSNGKAMEAVGENGKAIMYTYEVVLPHDAQRIQDGVKVRIIDHCGVNIFDGKHKNESDAFYRVQGYDPTGQRYQNRKIWL